MKKSVLIITAVFCAVIVVASFFVSGKSNIVSASASPVSCEIGETETKLLSMLNHNYVYGSNFEDVDTIVNLSLNALSNFKSINNDIASEYLKDFVNNMYGLEVSSVEAVNGQNDGYITVANKGYTTYSHKDISLTYNEDGTITAETKVEVVGSDSISGEYSASTLFVKNENSAFGYNIVFSEIITDNLSI